MKRSGFTFLVALFLGALLTSSLNGQARPDAVVASDGTGNFRTVQEAVNAVPQTLNAGKRWVIFIKSGTYRETVYIQHEKRFLTLVGEDPLRTTITYNLNANTTGPDSKPIGTFRTPTVVIDADDFSAENLTFENNAGPVGQAVAIRVDGDRVVFRNCRFLGWQDTILLNRGRHYFEDSLITGHVDFIFGGATAFFEKCRIHAWRSGYITAASTPQNQRYGFIFHNTKITGESADVKIYLGRPWRDFAQVAFLETDMDDIVRPAGWHNWDKPEREMTARYAEYGSTGPGAKMDQRVRWAKQLAESEANAMTVDAVLGAEDHWNPRAVPSYPATTKASMSSIPRPPQR